MTSSSDQPKIVRHMNVGETCCDLEWEAAYRRFETPEEEIEKFIRRLRAFGLDRQPKNIRIAELFCGRGGGLVALDRIGLTNVEGVDLSESLLQEYRGNATLHLADCRSLPFDDHSFDAAVVHGGMHHLPTLPADLESVLSEVSRILKPAGTFYAVEPWLTPFLRFVHAILKQPLIRRIYGKGDALAEMIEHERETYEQWLGQPNEVLDLFRRYFVLKQHRTAWGKLQLAATPADATISLPHSSSGGNS